MIGFFIIWLFIILAVLIFLGTRRSFFTIRRGHRPLAVRVVCGLLALFLLGSMLHGLRAQIRQSYTADTSDELHLPIETAELTAEALAAGEFDLLVQLVVGTFLEPGFFALEAKEIRVSWPDMQGETLDLQMRPAGHDLKVTFRLGDVKEWTQFRNTDANHILEVNYAWENSRHGQGTGSNVLPLPGVLQVFNRGLMPLFRHPYSLIPGWETNLVVVCVGTPILRDDPGRIVPVEDLIAERSGAIQETLSRTRYLRYDTQVHGLISLIQWTGPQFFLLVLAAILGAQCFRQRGLGFTLCMTLLMVCLVSMDQHHRTHHQRRAENEALSVSEREIARQRSEVSFFFRQP